MKAIKCTLHINSRLGYCFSPVKFNSISEAVRYARDSWGFAYRIFSDETGKCIKRGFCD